MRYLVVVCVFVSLLSLSSLAAAQGVQYTPNPFTGCSGYTSLPGQPCGPSPQDFAMPYQQPSFQPSDQRRLPGAFGNIVPRSNEQYHQSILDGIQRRQAERSRVLREFRENLRRQTEEAQYRRNAEKAARLFREGQERLRKQNEDAANSAARSRMEERASILTSGCHKYSRECLNRLRSLGQ